MRTWSVRCDEATMTVVRIPTLDEALDVAIRLKRGGVPAKIRPRWGRKCRDCFGLGFYWREVSGRAPIQALCWTCDGAGLLRYPWRSALVLLVAIGLVFLPPGWWL